ncbi:MAG: hypothetical protein HRU70_12460 [Phycisphaeraceae bacterium]|nr:MAG: hypothetical protein HRU70_12460 [Phycisphaeraceae bacterium]
MLSPALALAGLTFPDEAARPAGTRALIEWAAARPPAARPRAVQLDATSPDTRPRDLDRSARRDLAAVLRRHGLGFAGLDLWIPPGHFVEPAHADRALAAALAAISLAGDLATLAGDPRGRVVCVELPANGSVEGEPMKATLAAVRAAIADAAARADVAVADFSRGFDPPVGPLTAGIDPAGLLLAGLDPAMHAARLTITPAAARLADADASVRRPLGLGRLDPAAYLACLHARGFTGYPVIDLRALPDASDAFDRAAGALGLSR